LILDFGFWILDFGIKGVSTNSPDQEMELSFVDGR